MTKLLSLLAVVALFAGCTSPLTGTVSRIAPPQQQTMVTGEDAWARDLMKADLWADHRNELILAPIHESSFSITGSRLVISKIEFTDFEITSGYPGNEDFPLSDFLQPLEISPNTMHRLTDNNKSAVRVELSQTYPTVPTTQSAMVNALNGPTKIALK